MKELMNNHNNERSVPAPSRSLSLSKCGEGWVGLLKNMKKLLYISRYPALAVLLLMLLALAPAMAQNNADKTENTATTLNPNGANDTLPYVVANKGGITVMAVDSVDLDSYGWELYNDSTLNFAVAKGVDTSNFAEFVGGRVGHKVKVKWKETGLYFYRVTTYNVTGCTMNLKVGIIKVVAEKKEDSH
jgi:hypothetical protein